MQMKESRNMSVVRKNVSIAVEGLQSTVKTVDQLRPNTEYVIQTHAIYRMTGYNANENLTLYSAITRQRTEGEGQLVFTLRVVKSLTGKNFNEWSMHKTLTSITLTN